TPRCAEKSSSYGPRLFVSSLRGRPGPGCCFPGGRAARGVSAASAATAPRWTLRVSIRQSRPFFATWSRVAGSSCASPGTRPLQREMACDDMVLAQIASPRAYASYLISFAEKLQGRRGLALAQALVNRMHQMSLRVAQILDPKRPRRSGLWKPVLGFTAGML